jgi:hypothetical protein
MGKVFSASSIDKERFWLAEDLPDLINQAALISLSHRHEALSDELPIARGSAVGGHKS